MPRTTVRARGAYVALTVSHKGRLLKNKLSDPDVGLPDDLKREQATPVVVSLRPLREVPTDRILDQKAVNELRQKRKDSHVS